MVPHTFTLITCCVCGDCVGAVFAPTDQAVNPPANIYCHFCMASYKQMAAAIACEINGYAADAELIPTTAINSTITARGFNWRQAFIGGLAKLDAVLTQIRVAKFNESRQKNSA